MTLNMSMKVKRWVYPILVILPIFLIPVSRIADVTSFVNRLMRFISKRGVVYHAS